MTFRHPVDPSTIGSGYKWRPDPFTGKKQFHHGLDYAVPTGTPVFSSAPGTVSFVGIRSGYGNTVIIDHPDDFQTLYAHLSKFNVSVGSKVNLQTLIAYSGNTGKSTGSHLHFSIFKNKQSVNPNSVLNLPNPIPQKSTIYIPLILLSGFFYFLFKK